MKQLFLIIKTEYLTDVKSKSFWIASILVPLLAVGFGVVIGIMSANSDTLQTASNPFIDESSDLSVWQVLGMLTSVFLVLFLMMNGAQIFNKVRVEKCNRIVEILATCVEGRTMMLAKIITVGAITLTQILLWVAIGAVLLVFVLYVFSPVLNIGVFLSLRFFFAILWALAYFIGGYVFYGALYAACGAMSDKNNENQEYMTVLTFILLGTFYLGMYSIDHLTGQFALWLSFIPFTAPAIGPMRAIAGGTPLWQSFLSLALLFFFAWLALEFAGRVYKSTLLLTGKRLSPKDIILFLKAK